jgi:hypothetical protein
VSSYDRPDEIIQVGSTCVDDFVGKKTLSQIMGAFDICAIISNPDYWDEMDREYASSPRKFNHFPVDTFICLSRFMTEKYGFNKSDQENSTRDTLRYFINKPSDAPQEVRNIIYKAFSAERDTATYTEVNKIVDWFNSQSSDSNYLKNAHSLLKRDFFELGNNFSAGMLASMPSVYIRGIAKIEIKQQEARGEILNESFGSKKERGPLKLTVTKVKENVDRDYPNVTYGFRDDQGRKFSWKSSWPGNPKLEMNKTFVLNATIKDHSEFQGTHYTFINRCADVESVEKNSEAPDFSAGAKKRPFKENMSFSLSVFDEDNNITGDSFIMIERQWREGRKVLDFKYAIPIPVHDGYEAQVISQMANLTGANRGFGKELDLSNKNDKQFIMSMADAIRPYTHTIRPENGKLFLVEDAYAPLIQHKYSERWGKPNASSNELSKRKPQIFFDQAQAESHGRTIIGARLIEINMLKWEPLVVPDNIRRENIDTLLKLKEKAILEGYNAIVYMRDQDHASKIEPLGWTLEKVGDDFTIIKQKPVHDAVDQLQSRMLNGNKFITITGIDNPILAQGLKERFRRTHIFSDLLDNHIVPDMLSRTSPSEGGQLGNITLANILDDDTMLSTSLKHPMLIITDAVTSHYLRIFGADVVEISAQQGVSSQLPYFSAPTCHIDEEDLSKTCLKIKDIALNILNSPNRDFSRAMKR